MTCSYKAPQQEPPIEERILIIDYAPVNLGPKEGSPPPPAPHHRGGPAEATVDKAMSFPPLTTVDKVIGCTTN
jgi:hypothetical protein